MEEGFSFVGMETLSVSEYLPILEKIKDDLKYVYEMRLSDTGSRVQLLETPMTSELQVGDDQQNARSLQAETCPELSGKISELITSLSDKSNEQGKDVETLILSLQSLLNKKEQCNPLLIKELEDQITNLKEDIAQKDAEIISKDGKIEGLKNQKKSQEDENTKKDEKIKNLNEKMKSLKEENIQKDNKIQSLENDLSKIQKEHSAIKNQKEAKKPSSDMKVVLEEKIQRISELEMMISKLESKIGENSENQEKVRELELKIKQMDLENDINNDDYYNQLLDNLKDKRRELRDRDHKIQDLESEIADVENKFRKLEKENKTIYRNLEETKKENLELEKIRDDIETKYRSKCKECREYMRSMSSPDDCEKNVEEINGLKASIKEKDTELNRKDKIYNDLKTQYEENKKKLADTLKQLSIIEEKLKALEIDYNKKVDELAKKSQAILNMKEKIKAEDKDKTDAGDLKKTKNQLRHKELEIDQYQAKVENLTTAFEEKAADCDNHLKRINQLNKELEDLKKLHFTTKGQNPNMETMKPDPKDPIPDWWRKHMK